MPPSSAARQMCNPNVLTRTKDKFSGTVRFDSRHEPAA
jgi:hypothetical protein